MVAKRNLSSGGEMVAGGNINKKPRGEKTEKYIKVASAENAAKVDKNPPLGILLKSVSENSANVAKGDSVVYWMRMEDLRIVDNKALSLASSQANRDKIPLITLFVISPQDYEAHDRASRRIDFMLRNLILLKRQLEELNIPMYVITHEPRRTIPEKVISLMEEWGAKSLYANISYEIDELRRDTRTSDLAKSKQLRCEFVQDKLIVNPGTLTTKEGKAYAVYSPWLRNWIAKLNGNLDWLSEAPSPSPNDKSIRSSPQFSTLFQSTVPEHVKGFECKDKVKMSEYWPAGNEEAVKRLDTFFYGKATHTPGFCPASDEGPGPGANSRIKTYADGRNRADVYNTSRISPYLASGVISSRECVRRTMKFLGAKKVEAGRDNGVGMWVQEVAWRDFYNHVLVAFPRVSMGRPYNEKYAEVQWETNDAHFQAWKDGKTGVPIVDAAMRQLKEFGWMHNRCRMTVAMYLTKDLMLDWRLGERHFAKELIDSDLASNNGGWQWSASTGTDPQPYFRIFNPVSQSHKADPSGDYIRHFVPELSKLSGNAIHEPSPESADAHGYPRPLVDHKKSRERALRRYKNPGEQ